MSFIQLETDLKNIYFLMYIQSNMLIILQRGANPSVFQRHVSNLAKLLISYFRLEYNTQVLTIEMTGGKP